MPYSTDFQEGKDFERLVCDSVIQVRNDELRTVTPDPTKILDIENTVTINIKSLKTLPMTYSTSGFDLIWKLFFYKSRYAGIDFVSLGLIIWNQGNQYWEKTFRVQIDLILDDLETMTVSRDVNQQQPTIGCPVFMKWDDDNQSPLNFVITITDVYQESLISDDIVELEHELPGVKDFEVCCAGGRSFKVNKHLICGYSEFVRNLVLNGASKWDVEEDIEAIKVMMEVIYHKSKVLTMPEIEELLKLGNKYSCKYVSVMCRKAKYPQPPIIITD